VSEGAKGGDWVYVPLEFHGHEPKGNYLLPPPRIADRPLLIGNYLLLTPQLSDGADAVRGCVGVSLRVCVCAGVRLCGRVPVRVPTLCPSVPPDRITPPRLVFFFLGRSF
jgi:hypothetical protein